MVHKSVGAVEVGPPCPDLPPAPALSLHPTADGSRSRGFGRAERTVSGLRSRPCWWSPAGRGRDVNTFYRRVLDESPVPVADALGRTRLLTVVQGRWTRPVTAVVAGPGFGKTTLLAQAVRENRLARIGVDVHLRIEPADASAARLAARLLAQFGAEVPARASVDELIDRIVDTVWAGAPTLVCFVLDDVHELTREPTGSRCSPG